MRFKLMPFNAAIYARRSFFAFVFRREDFFASFRHRFFSCPVILCRHLDSKANFDKRLIGSGSLNHPLDTLSSKGISQVPLLCDALQSLLQGQSFEVFHSPLNRVLETKDRVFSFGNLHPTKQTEDFRLREINFGSMEGVSVSSFGKVKLFLAHPFKVPALIRGHVYDLFSGEGFVDVVNRVALFLEDFFLYLETRLEPSLPVVIFTHHVVINAFALLFGLDYRPIDSSHPFLKKGQVRWLTGVMDPTFVLPLPHDQAILASFGV